MLGTMFARFILAAIPVVAAPILLEAADPSCVMQQPLNFCDVAKKAIPATVYLKIQLVPGAGADYYSSEDPYGMYGEDLFEKFFGVRPQPKQPKQATARGSGFIVTEDGYILTNHHVIKDAKQITVVLNNGKEFSAQVVGTDHHTDLGVIKIEGSNLPYLNFADSDEVAIGEWVAAIGNPFELEASLTVGVVSGKGRQNLRITEFDDFIQTDAAINPGNSGGPLLNLDSEVIGVNTAILTRPGMGGYMGVGLAIPSNMAKHVMQQLIHAGNVTRGYLGVYLQPLDSDLSDALGLPSCEGALVADVSAGSPGEKAGLRQGDVIIGYDGRTVSSLGALRNQIALKPPGTTLKLQIIRDRKAIEVSVTLGTHPASVSPEDLLSKLGLTLRNLEQKETSRCPSGGVVVADCTRDSRAYHAGLRKGMIIQQVQRQPVKSVEEIIDQLQNLGEQRSVLIVATDGRQSRLYALKVE